MILAIIQARMSSKRFAGKVLAPILGKAMLFRQLERVKRAKRLDKIIIATSSAASDDAIEKLCEENQIACFRGKLHDVLDRYYQAAKKWHPLHIVRLTGDCPLIDPALIDHVIDHHIQHDYDYTSNTLMPTYPDGLDVEIIKFSALEDAWHKARLPSEREHVTAYLYKTPTQYQLGSVMHTENLAHFRLTVDEAHDLALVNEIYHALYDQNPAFTLHDILKLLEAKPLLKNMNAHYRRNSGLAKSFSRDQAFLAKKTLINKRYRQSQQLLEKALQHIPLAAQTFSKSVTQFPIGISPHFIQKGKGAHVFDVDGNEYIDFINSLAAVNLGYGDPDVDKAVREQLSSGVTFSLSHPLEIKVAEKIIEMVPCAEMVRFGKNGSDATAGAIRLARAYTGKEHIAFCGYHGWQDWYIGATSRNLGVPHSTQQLAHAFVYNDLPSLKRIFDEWPKQIAAIILEPMNVVYPAAGFLQSVRDLATKHNAVLIFDEMVTGFRFANGGAQAYFGVTPDLATFGKGIANGYPLSVITGRKEIMQLMESIFFSFTFGGETLSLAAAWATLTKLQNEPVIEKLHSLGTQLIKGLQTILNQYQLENLFNVSGHPAWSFLIFKDNPTYQQNEIKTLWLQEMFLRGLLSLGTHNLSYAHSAEDIKQLLIVYETLLPFLAQVIADENIHQFLHCNSLQTLFKVR